MPWYTGFGLGLGLGLALALHALALALESVALLTSLVPAILHLQH